MNTPPDLEAFVGLIYVLLAAIVTAVIDVFRRYVKHRLDLYEATHPIPKNDTEEEKEDKDKDA